MVNIVDYLLIIPVFSLLVSILIDRMEMKKMVIRVYSDLMILVSIIGLIVSMVAINRILDDALLESSHISTFRIDWLVALFLVFAYLIHLVVTYYSCYYIKSNDLPGLFAMISGMYIGITVVLISNNLITTFLGWEIMVISGYLLVVFNRSDKALEAGIKYLLLSTLGSMLMLFGIAILSGAMESLNYSDLQVVSNLFWGRIAIALLLTGIGVTAGIIFLNQWLPDAHSSAPTPVSALLSGVLVKIGIYLIYRLLNPLNGLERLDTLIVVIGVITLTEGNFMVFSQFFRKDIVDIKRIFAYSTIVHLGYLMLVISQYTETSHLALIYHIVNHGLAKALLFLSVGYLYSVYHTKDLRHLRGALRKDNTLAVVMIIGLFSLGGFPGTGGFVSKLLILIAMYDGLTVDLVWKIVILSIVLINTLLALIGYLLIIKILVFDESDQIIQAKEGTSRNLRFPLYVLSLIILVLGIVPNYFLDMILDLIPKV